MSDVMDEAADRLAASAEIDIAETRARFAVAAAAEKQAGLTLPKVSESVGVPYGTLHAWAAGTYRGENAGVAKRVANWLLTREARVRTSTTVRRAPGFLRTRTADRIFDVLEYAQTAPDMVIVSGGAGVGKTTALNAYRDINSNVWIMTAEPAIGTIVGLLDVLMDALGMEPSGGGGAVMSRRIRQRLTGTDGLLVVDEAQHLKDVLRDQLRSTVYDGAGIGVALVGNEGLNAQFARERATGKHAQLISRFGQRISRPKPFRADAEQLLDAWGVEGAEARNTALGIAMKPGALRQMNKTLRIAFGLSDLRNDANPTVADIEQAWKQLGGGAA